MTMIATLIRILKVIGSMVLLQNEIRLQREVGLASLSSFLFFSLSLHFRRVEEIAGSCHGGQFGATGSFGYLHCVIAIIVFAVAVGRPVFDHILCAQIVGYLGSGLHDFRDIPGEEPSPATLQCNGLQQGLCFLSWTYTN